MPASDQGVAQSGHRYQLVPRVLGFVTAGDDVLLLKGAPTKRIWAGKYNGIGGHVERGESPHAAIEREIREEAGLPVSDLRLRAVVTIDAGDGPGIGLYVFTAAALSRSLTASTEGAPEWVPQQDLLNRDLVEDLPWLLPRILALGPADPPLGAHYSYDADGRLVIDWHSGP